MSSFWLCQQLFAKNIWFSHESHFGLQCRENEAFNVCLAELSAYWN